MGGLGPGPASILMDMGRREAWGRAGRGREEREGSGIGGAVVVVVVAVVFVSAASATTGLAVDADAGSDAAFRREGGRGEDGQADADGVMGASDGGG